MKVEVMKIMKTASEYRLEAREALRGCWGLAIGITVVFAIITGALSSTFAGLIILGGAFYVGLSITFVNLFRRGTLQFSDLFSGFSAVEFTATIGVYVKTLLFTWLWSLLFVIPGIIKGFGYSMAPYILADHPGITGGEALALSTELMAGKKWNLFCLYLSFIGWDILSIFTLGILQLWITPWKYAAVANFYESIKDQVYIPGEATSQTTEV